jgi:hypothetical protein
VTSPEVLSAEVPEGLDAGVYDIVVVNPDETVGVLEDGFTITINPPPSVTSITPGVVPNNDSSIDLTITGADFRGAPTPEVVLICINGAGMSLADQTMTVAGWNPTSIDGTMDGTDYAGPANCIVKVTNTDDNTSAEYSSLVVVTPEENLTGFTLGPDMESPRRGLGAVSGATSQASRFVYAIAGDDGVSTLNTVEVLPVDIFGSVGDDGFFIQDYSLNTARTQIGAVRIDRFIYVVGGTSTMGSATAALNTVERAVILDPNLRPMDLDVDIDLSETDGLSGGIYYYRVAAVMPSDDPFNPDGETLASSPFGMHIPTLVDWGVEVTLSWEPVDDAVGYRIYRTAADGAAGTEALIADTTAALPATVICPTATSCTDLGATPDTAETPLKLGSTGKWVTIEETMATPRQGPGVTWALDPSDSTTAYIYVLGGLDATGAALATHEFLTIDIAGDGSQDTSAGFTNGSENLSTARWRLKGYTVTELDTLQVDGTYVWAGGGATAGGAMVDDFEGAAVLDNGTGQLDFLSNDSMNPQCAGYGAFVAGDLLYAIGGQNGSPSQENISIEHTGSPPGLQNFQGFTPGLKTPRVDLGAAIQSGYFYVLGGQTNTETASKSTEYVLY